MTASPSPSPVYDTIGLAYVAHRRPDPRWEAVIGEQLGDARVVVERRRGTGSYEPADRAVIAIEPSCVMISQRPPGARRRSEPAPLPYRSLRVLPTPQWRC